MPSSCTHQNIYATSDYSSTRCSFVRIAILCCHYAFCHSWTSILLPLCIHSSLSFYDNSISNQDIAIRHREIALSPSESKLHIPYFYKNNCSNTKKTTKQIPEMSTTNSRPYFYGSKAENNKINSIQ